MGCQINRTLQGQRKLNKNEFCSYQLKETENPTKKQEVQKQYVCPLKVPWLDLPENVLHSENAKLPIS